MSPTAGLIAVDGVNGAALKAAARATLKTVEPRHRGGVSTWDASGVFEELTVAGADAGLPSARTLLLLYAADLAFRLRWEIRPALSEGRVVVAAPYIDTAIAFGRAAGLPGGWLTDLFRFAPRPTKRQFVEAAPVRDAAHREGFVEFGREWTVGQPRGLTRRELIDRVRAHLHATAYRKARGHRRHD